MPTQRSPHELERYLQEHPETRYLDAFLSDLNGVERGKRLVREGMARLFEAGLPMPGSMFALDVRGGTAEATGLGFDEGDADRPCLPVAGTLVPVPWKEEAVAQVQLAMHEADGRPFFADPRQVLAGVLERLHALELTPVVALEYEFYLVDRERGADGLPRPPPAPLTGRRELRTQINSMAELDEYAALLAAIDTACRAQAVPARSALAEYGPAQYEVNLQHVPDALLACDQAVRFKRIVRSVARAHGCEATFLAKPYRGLAGSGLHVHVSLLDRSGRNLFACEEAASHEPLRHAVAGLLATLAEGMAICAPNANSYRRFRPEAYVPLTAGWSVDNRGAALRIPASDAANRRIEHRLAGADANPYLVVAWVLAGIHHGMTRRLQPPAPFRGNAFRQGGERLPVHWPLALERFEASGFAREYLGGAFARLYATVKRSELDEFASYPTPLECAWYLGPL